jgi:hypothetical protein
MNELEKWPVSIVDRDTLVSLIGKFLRTHRDGRNQLFQLLDSIPGDRTEAEFSQERKEARDRHQAHKRDFMDRVNAQQRAEGKPVTDIEGNIIEGRGAPRNRKQTEAALADRKKIEKIWREKPHLTAKQFLQILGWPANRLRAIERHLRDIRASI